MFAAADTIAAIATPAGRGGIGVVRLSGPDARHIAQQIVTLTQPFSSHRVHHGNVTDREGRVLDTALATWFAAPHSYTGEDVVEISSHGSPVVVQAIVELSLELGARLAEPGEFTERAFLNGKLDLTQAEAVRDLIDSSTVAQARLAAEQLNGSLQREVRPAKDNLLLLIATLEAGIDFAEDDLETMSADLIGMRIAELQPPLRALLASFSYGRVLREGLRLAIVGKPNSGKSSLFNRLLERERAIVTPIAGTTRDVVSERAVIAGLPVELLDTAGLRETDDVVERIGVQRSREAMADADVVLLVTDATHPDGSDDASALAEREPGGLSEVRVWNKADLLNESARSSAMRNGAVLTSALTGEGMDALRIEILRRAGVMHDKGNATLTNVRQHNSIDRALTALERAAAACSGTPHEMLLLDLYEALEALDELTGKTTADDVLHRIFSTFCIGK